MDIGNVRRRTWVCYYTRMRLHQRDTRYPVAMSIAFKMIGYLSEI